MTGELMTTDAVENSTAPLWTAEERAAIFQSELERLVKDIADTYFTCPLPIQRAYDRAQRLLNEINGIA